MTMQGMRNVGASFGASNVVPLKSKVKDAIKLAAGKLTAAKVEGKKLEAAPPGTQIQAGTAKLPKSVDASGEPARLFVCVIVGGAASPWQKADGNHAEQFYVSIGTGKGAVTYGPIDFANPLVKPAK